MSEGPKTAVKLLGIAVGFAAVGVLLYRQRVINPGPIWYFDSVTFFLPALAALLANAWIFGMALPYIWRLRSKITATCGLAILATFLTFCAYMIVALNTYGS
jgi:hypothetical protein